MKAHNATQLLSSALSPRDGAGASGGTPGPFYGLYNNYSMSPSWIWSDKITNERVARVGYNHFISNEGEWNNCFSKFSNRVLPPIFVSTILQSVRKENLAHYFSYDVKLRLLSSIVGVLRHMENSAPSLKIFRFAKIVEIKIGG